jgi:hypothetical protein
LADEVAVTLHADRVGTRDREHWDIVAAVQLAAALLTLSTDRLTEVAEHRG